MNSDTPPHRTHPSRASPPRPADPGTPSPVNPPPATPPPVTPPAAIVLRFDQGTLVLRGLDQDVAPPETSRFGWTWDHRSLEWRCAALHYAEARRGLAAMAPDRLVDEVATGKTITWKWCTLPMLRPEQSEALAAWRSGDGTGVVVMPTGTGKTEVALTAMYRLCVPTLIVAPIRVLMHQWHERIHRALGVRAGLLGDGHDEVRPITVTTYDSAYRHMDRIGHLFDFLVFDEVHHLPGANRRDAALLSTAPLRMGLTATPERADRREADLDELVGPVVYRLEIPDVRGGTLAEYGIQRIEVELTPEERCRHDRVSAIIRAAMDRQRRERPEYTWMDLCTDSATDAALRRVVLASRERRLIEERAAGKLFAVEDLLRLHAEDRILLFAGSNEMVMDVSRRFLVPAILAHSRKAERTTILTGFADGRFRMIATNQVLDEGIDIPAVKVAIVLGGKSSARQAKQRLGRILRRSGDRTAVLYEVSCSFTRDEIRSQERRENDAYIGPVNRELWRWSRRTRSTGPATAPLL